MTDSTEEAREVRNAIGAVCAVLNTKDVSTKEGGTKTLDMVEQVEELRGMCEDEAGGREVVGCVVLVGEDAEKRVDEMEEGLRSERGIFGWDVVGWDGETENDSSFDETKKNEFGEKLGIERIKEILEAVPWTTSSTNASEAEFLDSDNEPDWTTSEQRELDREMMGLKMDLHEEGEDENEDKAFGEDEWPELQGGSEDVKVEQLQGLMERLIATREAASEMSGGEKQKFAKREVERIMREMG
jgi:Alpha and gamma adaptin binding protein p34